MYTFIYERKPRTSSSFEFCKYIEHNFSAAINFLFYLIKTTNKIIIKKLIIFYFFFTSNLLCTTDLKSTNIILFLFFPFCFIKKLFFSENNYEKKKMYQQSWRIQQVLFTEKLFQSNQYIFHFLLWFQNELLNQSINCWLQCLFNFKIVFIVQRNIVKKKCYLIK